MIYRFIDKFIDKGGRAHQNFKNLRDFLVNVKKSLSLKEMIHV